MAALTEDTNRLKKGQISLQRYPVAADAVIYYGAIVCINASGYLAAAADAANFKCVGIAEESFDNTGGSNGDGHVRVYRGAAKVATTGGSAVAQANVGGDAVILDDNTVVLAAGATNDIVAGEVLEVEADGVWINFTGVR
jgi:hypothetical protein